MSCLKFALLSRSPVSLKKEDFGKGWIRQKKGECRPKEQNKTQQSTRPPVFLWGEDTHKHLLPSLTILWCFQSSSHHCGNLCRLFHVFTSHPPYLLFSPLNTCTRTNADIPLVPSSSRPFIHTLPSSCAKTKPRAERTLR